MANGNVHSFKVATTLAAYRGVYISAANTVAYQNTLTSYPIGTTLNTVDDTTQALAVQLDGPAKLTFNDTVSAGALVGLDTSGRGIPFVGATGTFYSVGRVLTAVSATGTVADILIAQTTHYVL